MTGRAAARERRHHRAVRGDRGRTRRLARRGAGVQAPRRIGRAHPPARRGRRRRLRTRRPQASSSARCNWRRSPRPTSRRSRSSAARGSRSSPREASSSRRAPRSPRGQIPESNALLLGSPRARGRRARSCCRRPSPTSTTTCRGALAEAAALGADAVITSGGVSAGAYEVVRTGVAGMTLHEGRDAAGQAAGLLPRGLRSCSACPAIR